MNDSFAARQRLSSCVASCYKDRTQQCFFLERIRGKHWGFGFALERILVAGSGGFWGALRPMLSQLAQRYNKYRNIS
jgi:hypothetical protein